jgi:hypothetical protein
MLNPDREALWRLVFVRYESFAKVSAVDWESPADLAECRFSCRLHAVADVGDHCIHAET